MLEEKKKATSQSEWIKCTTHGVVEEEGEKKYFSCDSVHKRKKDILLPSPMTDQLSVVSRL